MGFLKGVGNLIGGLIKGIFETILLPVLKLFFDYIWPIIRDMIGNSVVKVIMYFYRYVLKLLRFLSSVFDAVSGLKDISYKGNGMTLVDVMFSNSGVSRALALITVMATALAFIFAIVETVKSMGDLPFDEKAKPISTVIKNGFKAAIVFMIIPFLCLFILRLSTLLLRGVGTAFQYGNGASQEVGIDDVIFYTSIQEAADANVTEKYRAGHLYEDYDQVAKDLNLMKVDYLVGLIAAVFMFFIMVSCSIIFVRRAYELLVLYLISPFFAATIVSDGGNGKFNRWRDMFVAKFFSGFGTVISMKLYLLVLPALTGNQITFTSEPVTNLMIHLLFVLGGAYAVFQGQATLLDIIDQQTGSHERESADFISGYIIGGIKNRYHKAQDAKKRNQERLEDMKKQAMFDRQRQSQTGMGRGGSGNQFRGGGGR